MNDQYNVLLIDRDINHLQQLFQFLELHRVYNVMSATSGEMAVLIAQKKRIDIIVLDWETAIAAGVDVLNELQSSEGYRPVVILASPTQYEKDKDFINTKAVECLEKPVDKEQFLSTIRQVVQSDSPKPKYTSKEEELNAKAQQLETEIESFKQKKLQLEREVGFLEEKKKTLEQKEQTLGTQEQNIREQSKMIELEKVKVQESAQDVLVQQQELNKKVEELSTQEEELNKTKEELSSQKEAISNQKESIDQQSKELEEKTQFEEQVKAQELAEFKHQTEKMTQMQKQTMAHFLPPALRDSYLQDEKAILQSRNEVIAVVMAVENIQELKEKHEVEAIEEMLQALGETWQNLGEKHQLTPISSREGALVMGNGILKKMPFNAENVLKMAWEMGEFAEDFRQRQEIIPDISLTINLGNLIIGKINQKFMSYDFWGDLTEAMETGGKNQFPLISDGAYQLLRDKIETEKFGQTRSPQLGIIDLYWIKNIKIES